MARITSGRPGRVPEPNSGMETLLPAKVFKRRRNIPILSHRETDWVLNAKGEFQPCLQEHRVTPGALGVSGVHSSNPYQEALSFLGADGERRKLIHPHNVGNVGPYWHEVDLVGGGIGYLFAWEYVERFDSGYQIRTDHEKYMAYCSKLLDAGLIYPLTSAVLNILVAKQERRVRTIETASSALPTKYAKRIEHAKNSLDTLVKLVGKDDDAIDRQIKQQLRKGGKQQPRKRNKREVEQHGGESENA